MSKSRNHRSDVMELGSGWAAVELPDYGREGKPCNSSIGPASWSGFDDDEYDGLWFCIGCGKFFEHDELPHDSPDEGLNALAKIKHED